MTTTINYQGEVLTLVEETYTNGRVCLSLWAEDGPFCKVTTNCPEVHLNEGEVLVKDWSENEPIAKALVEQGVLIPTGREVSSGFVFPMVARLA